MEDTTLASLAVHVSLRHQQPAREGRVGVDISRYSTTLKVEIFFFGGVEWVCLYLSSENEADRLPSCSGAK